MKQIEELSKLFDINSRASQISKTAKEGLYAYDTTITVSASGKSITLRKETEDETSIISIILQIIEGHYSDLEKETYDKITKLL